MNNFSPKQALSTHGMFEGFKSSLMWMIWAFKLSFGVDILVLLAPFSKKLAKFGSIILSHWLQHLLFTKILPEGEDRWHYFVQLSGHTGFSPYLSQKYFQKWKIEGIILFNYLVTPASALGFHQNTSRRGVPFPVLAGMVLHN